MAVTRLRKGKERQEKEKERKESKVLWREKVERERQPMVVSFQVITEKEEGVFMGSRPLGPFAAG